MSVQSYKKQDPYATGSGVTLDKMAIFQECLQQFNTSPVNVKKCRTLLAKLLLLIYQGENFPVKESTTLFFSISKLFQHKNLSLRQMVYLTTKELSTTSQDILMVTSPIMKDIQSGNMVYKPDAIRTISKVLDLSTVSASERLFRNCIVDKNPIVSSAALVSVYKLLPIAKDVVRRFMNETLETIQSRKQFPSNQFELHEYYGNSTTNLPFTSYMYQYHALGLLYSLRSHDKMGLMKLITSLSEGSALQNSLSLIQLIRYINKILLDDQSLINVLFPILSGLLKHKSDMVELEACKSLINLQHLLKEQDFMHIITTLQKLLHVPRIATRFAAIRLINKISLRHPEKLIVVNLELENMINDTNRSISTLAITTLLKTLGAGTIESQSEGGKSVDRLVSKMTSLMDEIAEDFKIVIIEAIENLALKFPSKHKKLVSFLTELLRDDGTLHLKSAIVDVLFDLIKFLPDNSGKQLILMNLCEFIEDCEFTELSVRILHLLGEEGPHTSNPSYYIRHIYNRLVLENSIVRSSAVISLAKFAVCGGDISKNINILLGRCLNDIDDEVRDRTALSLAFIKGSQKNLIITESKYDLVVLESKLTHYLNDDSNFGKKFDMNEVPVISNEELKSLDFKEKVNKLESGTTGDGIQDAEPSRSHSVINEVEKEPVDEVANSYLRQQEYAQELSAIPEFSSYGKLTKSSESIYLTDKENEFVVTTLKHFFVDSRKLVFQYNIENTLPNLLLQDVSVVVQPDNELYKEDFILPLQELKPHETGLVYVSFSMPDLENEDVISVFGNTLSYRNKEIIDEHGNVDEADEGWTDEYQIEDIAIDPGDFINPLYNPNFTETFDALPYESSFVVNLSSSKTLENAANRLKSVTNTMPLEASDYIKSDETSHILKLLGKDVWGGKVALFARMAMSGGKVVSKIQVKADNEKTINVVNDGTS